MTFTNPLFLFALAGALVPVLLHLFARRTIRSVPFSSLIFLTSLERNALRWTRITQRHLLVLRVAILALIAVALARPVCGPRIPIRTIIVLDASASMGAERGAVWQRGLDAVMTLSRVLPGPVELATATTSLYLMGTLPGEIRERERVVRSLSPSCMRLDMPRVLSEAAACAAQAGGPVRLVIVSDFQPGAWADSLRIPAEVEAWGVPVTGAKSNLWLGRLSMSGTVRGQGSVDIHGTVHGSGQVPNSCVVTLRTPEGQDSRRLAMVSDETPFTFPVWRSGAQPFSVEVVVDDPNGVVLDDRRMLTRWSEELCRVWVYGGDDQSRERFRVALDPSGDHRWGFAVTDTRIPSWPLAEPPDVMVVLGAPALTGEAVTGVQRWQAHAGILLVADDLHLSDHGAALFRRVVGQTLVAVADGARGLAQFDYTHPILAPFKNLPPRGLVPPSINRYWVSSGDAHALITLDDDGLLIERSGGRQPRALALMSGFIPPWSDWSSRASFVPLMHLLIDHAAGALPVHHVTFGTEFSCMIPWPPGSQPTLRLPDGSTVPVYPDEVDAGVARVRLGPFVEPGLYGVWHSGEPLALFEPVLDPLEQPAEPATRPSQVRWIENPTTPGIASLAPMEPATVLLMLAVFALLAEAWLGLRITRGAPPTSR